VIHRREVEAPLVALTFDDDTHPELRELDRAA
jgi:hypothetical protein